MTCLFLDIETIPAQTEPVITRIASTIKPPATMKKAETIATWEKDQKEAAIEEAIAKTSLNGALGSICCFGFALDDGDVSSLSWPLNVDTEAVAIRGFFDIASQAIGNRFPVIVGHNVANFDIRFIWQRAMVLGVRVPAWMPRSPKPWDKDVFDTMAVWAGARDTISMDNLCAALGIPGKDGVDGSMVGEMFAKGQHKEIASYCRDDVERTRAIYRRMQVALGGMAA